MPRLFKYALAVGALWAGSRITRARADEAISAGFAYGSQKVRGVNIGGWLVTEPWITPSLFEKTGNEAIVDEYTFCQYQDAGAAKAALQSHWDSFYTEGDFAAIAAAGFNHVRIPIGYWAFEVGPGEPYITGQLPYLERAVGWATNHGLKVIIDLHGAPGSQNGFDNSGQRLDLPTWHTNPDYVDRTEAIIKTIADMYKDNTANVPTIAPLNEPSGFDGADVLSVTEQFWKDSYGSIRFPYGSDRQSNTVVMIHDAFQEPSYWNGFMSAPEYQGVLMDTHRYQIFTEDINMSPDEHVTEACNQASDIQQFTLNTVVGEFTPAFTDCAKYLNGRGIGARYDGSYPGSSRIGSCAGFSGSASSFSQEYKTQLRKFWEAQTHAYESGGEGWIHWTWKTEAGTAEEWSYSAGIANGFLPADVSARQFPNICN